MSSSEHVLELRDALGRTVLDLHQVGELAIVTVRMRETWLLHLPPGVAGDVACDLSTYPQVFEGPASVIGETRRSMIEKAVANRLLSWPDAELMFGVSPNETSDPEPIPLSDWAATS